MKFFVKSGKVIKFLEFILYEWFVYINIFVVLINDKCILRYKCILSGFMLLLVEGIKFYKIFLKSVSCKDIVVLL